MRLPDSCPIVTLLQPKLMQIFDEAICVLREPLAKFGLQFGVELHLDRGRLCADDTDLAPILQRQRAPLSTVVDRPSQVLPTVAASQ